MPETFPPLAMLGGMPIAEIARLTGERRLPPVDRWNPAFYGDSGMVIARDGRWFHEGSPIERPAMVRLFAGLLRREDAGYMLVTPVEKVSIAVEDLPFLAVELMSEGVGDARRLALRLITDDVVIAGPEHPLTWEDARPAVEVRAGLMARIARPVYYELAELALEEGNEPPGLWSDGRFFAMSPA